eukprot:g34913.t1
MRFARLQGSDYVQTTVCGHCQSSIWFPPDTEHALCGVCSVVLDPPQTVFNQNQLQLKDFEKNESKEGKNEDKQNDKSQAKETIAVISSSLPSETTNSAALYMIVSNFFFSLIFPCFLLKSMRSKGCSFCLAEWWWRLHTFLFAVVVCFWFTYFPYIGGKVVLPAPTSVAARWELLPQDSVYRNVDLQDCWRPNDCIPRYVYCPQGEGWTGYCPEDEYWWYWCDVAECGMWTLAKSAYFPTCDVECDPAYFNNQPANGTICPLSLDRFGKPRSDSTKICPPPSWNDAQEPIYFANFSGNFCANKYWGSKCKEQTVSPSLWCPFASIATVAATATFVSLKKHFVYTFRNDKRCSFSQVFRIIFVDLVIPALFIFSIVVLAIKKHHHLFYLEDDSKCKSTPTGDRECERPVIGEDASYVEQWWMLSLLLSVPMHSLISVVYFCLVRKKRTNYLRRRGVTSYVENGGTLPILLRVHVLLPECPPSVEDQLLDEGLLTDGSQSPARASLLSDVPLSPISPSSDMSLNRSPRKRGTPTKNRLSPRKRSPQKEGKTGIEGIEDAAPVEDTPSKKINMEAMHDEDEEIFKLQPADDMGVRFSESKSQFLSVVLVVGSFAIGGFKLLIQLATDTSLRRHQGRTECRSVPGRDPIFQLIK